MEDYKVIRAVGKGSFGKVYLVRHVAEGRQYVMKVIKLKGIPAKEREACRNEVILMQRLQHPNIVAYKDSFFTNDRDSLCIVMTYCDGGDLAGRLGASKGTLIKEDQIMHWFVQMALAIHYMHENKVLHRDIKTQNIFLLGNGRLVLGDLGISKVLDGTAAFAKTQIGTPYYMSPELFKNSPYNHKSDVWALGCVLYELCTLCHPFEATSLHGLGAKIMTGKYTPINAKYSQSLRALIGSMLALSPASRPSMTDVLQQPYIKKHIFNFLKDIVDRSAVTIAATPLASGPVGEGTMMFKAAALRVAAGSSAGSDAMAKAIAAGLGPHANNLQQQLINLGLQPMLAKVIADADMPKPTAAIVASAATAVKTSAPSAPVTTSSSGSAPSVSASAVAASVDAKEVKKIVKESQAALDREEERRRAVEAALDRLKKEKELRSQQREEFMRKQERLKYKHAADPAPRSSLFGSPAVKTPSVVIGTPSATPASVSGAPSVASSGSANSKAPVVRVPVGMALQVTPSAAQLNPKPPIAKAVGVAQPSVKSVVPGSKVGPSPSAPAVDAKAAALKDRHSAIRRDMGKGPSPGVGGGIVKSSSPAPAPAADGAGMLAARRAEAERQRVAELEQWEKEKSNRQHAQAVGSGVARSVSSSDRSKAADNNTPRSNVTPSSAFPPASGPPSRSVSVGSRGEAPDSNPSSHRASLSSDKVDPRAVVVPGAGSRVPSPLHARNGSSPAAIPAAAAPRPLAQRSVSESSVPSGEPITGDELAPFLPPDFDRLSARDKVFARSKAMKKLEEARQMAQLQAAALEGAVDRKRAQYLQRGQYSGVQVALAGALPIHATVLEKVVAETTDLVSTLQSQLPGARYQAPASMPVVDELPSESKHEDVVAGVRDLCSDDFLPPPNAGDDSKDEGYGEGELPDSDSEDSVILEEATFYDDAKASEAPRKRITLDSGEEDEEEIRAEEARLRNELIRSTMRCTDLRMSLEVARKMAHDAGYPLGRQQPQQPQARPTSALVGTSQSIPVPNDQLDADNMRKSHDERPIRPSAMPGVFGTADISQSVLPSKAVAGGANNFMMPSPAFTTVQEVDEEDEDDIGDEDGNEEGGISFKSLPLGSDELEHDIEWRSAPSAYAVNAGSGVDHTDDVVPATEDNLEDFHGGGLSKKAERYREFFNSNLDKALFTRIYSELHNRIYGEDDYVGDHSDLVSLLPSTKKHYLEQIKDLVIMDENAAF